MLNIPLPRRRYNTTDYPNLDPYFIGRPIPIGYGTITGIAPTEIDTTTSRFKILDQAVSEITAIRSDTTDPMTKDSDYTEYLSLAEFVLLKNVQLNSLTTYYFAVESDYDESGTNYIELGRNEDKYSTGTGYSINASNAWTPFAPDFLFEIYGKPTLDGVEASVQANTETDATAGVGLKDAAARTRLGQSFRVSGLCYLTKITLYIVRHGTLTGKNIRIRVYSDTAGTQISATGTYLSIGTSGATLTPLIPDRNENEELRCDVVVPGTTINKVADILPDVIANIMGKSASLLDATELANLAADRTQDLKVFLPDAITFGDLVGKLEAEQLWKLVPLQDGTYGTIVYETGEPGNTPHFRDDDFLSFAMEHDNSKLKQTVDVFYDYDEALGEFRCASASSDVAKFFYMNEESMDAETFLAAYADASALASSYLARYEVPIITVIFEVHGWALDLLPGRDKVKLTRTRAAYAGGTLAGVLFRIVKLVKKPETNVVEITACVWGNSAT